MGRAAGRLAVVDGAPRGAVSATVLAVVSWHLVYRMAAVGGRAWVWGVIIALVAMIVGVVGAPRWAG